MLYEGLREEIGQITYLNGPMDYAKALKLRFRLGDLNLPEKRYTSSREEEAEGVRVAKQKRVATLLCLG